MALNDPAPGLGATCPVGGERPLTQGEVALVRSVFGDAVDCRNVTIRRRKFFPLQPRQVTMAPRGHLHFHPRGDSYCDDFAQGSLGAMAHFIHEMTHVWQTQTLGPWYLLLHRHPWCRYHYTLKPGWPLARYGIEQQAEIVRHAFVQSRGQVLAGSPGLAAYRAILPPEFALHRS